MNVKSDTEYIAKTGHTIDPDGSIPLNIKSELVRCEDCKHYYKDGTGWCDIHSHFFPGGLDWNRFDEEDFCSYGERR